MLVVTHPRVGTRERSSMTSLIVSFAFGFAINFAFVLINLEILKDKLDKLEEKLDNIEKNLEEN